MLDQMTAGLMGAPGMGYAPISSVSGGGSSTGSLSGGYSTSASANVAGKLSLGFIAILVLAAVGANYLLRHYTS